MQKDVKYLLNESLSLWDSPGCMMSVWMRRVGCHADSYRRGWHRWRPGRCGRWGRGAAAGRWCCRWWPPCVAPTPSGRAACSPLPTATWAATSSVAVNTHRDTLARPGAHTPAHGHTCTFCAQIPLIHPHTWGVNYGSGTELYLIGF